MRKKSTLTDLVHRYLPLIIVILEVTNQVLELVNKVVNYARPIPKLRILVSS